MKHSRQIRLLFGLFIALFGATVALSAVVAPAFAADQVPPKAVLPTQFDGWQQKDVAVTGDAAAADATNAPVLKEYGFQHLERATYVREDGRKLTIKAAQFADASGAYGAFTYYKVPEMRNEQIGAQASSLGNRVLFYQGSTLVDAVFERLSVMSAAELRELATTLPVPEGNARNLPTLPTYLPKTTYEANTAKYIMGPAALDRLGSPLPTPLVGFDSGAEVVIGKYSAQAGDATLMLISYPTPQIAAEKLRAIEATRQLAAPQQGASAIVDVTPFFDRRSGPIVAIASGPLSLSEAKSLLGSVSYDADVTWNENTYVTKKDNLANLLFNIILLCGILVGFALVGGLAFGGFRIVIKRFFPDSVFDRPEDIEIISLHLEEGAEGVSGRR